MTGLHRQRGQAPHESATDTQNVNVHVQILGSLGLTQAVAKAGRMRPMHDLNSELLMAAARLVVEQGLNFGAAKRHAVKDLGLPSRTALPANAPLEQAVQAHIALFCADTQPNELVALRRLALAWMERMAPFRPHLGGAVWRGYATLNNDVEIALFCDDGKMVEMLLIDQHVRYEVHCPQGLRGEPVQTLSIHALCPPFAQTVGVHLALYPHDAIRGALRPDDQGRSPRGNLAAVARLVRGVAP